MKNDVFGGETQIIADGAILDTLMTILDGTAFSGQKIHQNTRLFVFVNTLELPDGRRARQDGLKKLQKLLAHPFATTEPIPISILSFTEKLKRYEYLMENGCRLVLVPVETRVLNETQQIPSPEQWGLLLRLASEEELEIECSTYRHTLNSLMAAARIFLGAAMVGHVPNPVLWEKVLENLEKLAQNQLSSITFQRGLLVNSLKKHKRFRQDYEMIARPENINLQVLDDNFEKHGWKDVLETLLPKSVKGFTSWGELESQILKGEIPKVLLLDCNLGKGNDIPTGLELLCSIRGEWQEVRIIFMTAFDDAALALDSLREGANLFFAKSLNAATDRRSLDYYQHFVELLKQGKEEEKICELWREFRKKIDCNGVVTGNTPKYLPESGLVRLLRLGFYILFSELDNLWWLRKPGDLSGDYSYRMVINLIQIGYPKLEESAFYDNPQVQTLLRGGSHASRRIDLDEFESIMIYLFSKLDTPKLPASQLKPWARPKSPYWAYQHDALQSDSTHPGLPKGQVMLQHDVKDSLGAIELLRGVGCFNNCRHDTNSIDDVLRAHQWNKKKATYSDVMFVDDYGHQSEWFRVMDTIFPGCRLFQNIDAGLETLEQGNQVNLLILDLRLPTYEGGLDALERILSYDPSLPVLTISAGSDSFPAIRSLRHGAIDFISKTLPFARDRSSCFEFADEFVNKCELLLRFGRSGCRKFWRELQTLRKEIKWTTQDDLDRVISKLLSCSEHKKSLGNESEVEVPPRLDAWPSLMAEEMHLILHLRRQIFWLEAKTTVPGSLKRFNFDKFYQIRPLDFWRWEYVLQSSETANIVKLIAISCGILIERLARWNWCLRKEESFNPKDWGVTNGISIVNEFRDLRAFDIWDFRNAALDKTESLSAWDQTLCDKMIKRTFDTIHHFLSKYNASF